jgi:N-acetylglucosaminyldiphosphoundecaprenol N-acetyl-beta-D-mannosaminyltransferase
MPKRDILGVHLDVIDRDGLHEGISATIDNGRQDVYAYANIHAINLAGTLPRFRDFLNSAHVLYCDGEGVRLGARILGFALPQRVVLTYWAWDLCAYALKHGYSLFFLGAEEQVIRKAAENAVQRLPGLKVVGFHHGYFQKSGPENEAVVDMINAAAPDILLVGFGMPLQEEWIEANRSRLRVHAILPSGSLFDYMSGLKSVAPAWMANHGMEWAYRLFQEPIRLWKRYLVGNPLFFSRILAKRLDGKGP